MRYLIDYPNGAEFAFTILDDTDDTTVANGRPVYQLLKDAGIRTTKTVWAFDAPPKRRGIYFAGETLSVPEYLEWVHELHKDGFEIAFHNATMSSSKRKDTIKALDFIDREFEIPVRLHCNHGQNLENLHWGKDRYNSYLIKKMFSLFSKLSPQKTYEGGNPKSPYYWADIADQRLSYIRALAYRQLNGKLIPPGKPYVNMTKQKSCVFFNTADAPNVDCFNRLVTPKTIDILRKQRGWAIVSTHLGKGFCRKNKIDTEFRKTLEYMASKSGWFVPVSQLLDFLVAEIGVNELSTAEKSYMEILHVLDRISGRLIKSI